MQHESFTVTCGLLIKMDTAGHTKKDHVWASLKFNTPHHSQAWFTWHEGHTMHPHKKHCNITARVYFLNRWVLSCFPACWPAWLLWRSVWLWTVTIQSCWSSPQSQYPYRSDMPPASGEMHCEQRRTHATLRPVWHQALGRANKPEGKQKKIKLYW